MHIIKDLLEDKWEDKGPPPEDISTVADYQSFILSQRALKEEESYLTYYIKKEDGKLLTARFNDIKSGHDPLKSVRNCYLRIQSDNDLNIITGVILDHEWVERK